MDQYGSIWIIDFILNCIISHLQNLAKDPHSAAHPGLYRRILWCSPRLGQLTFQSTQSFQSIEPIPSCYFWILDDHGISWPLICMNFRSPVVTQIPKLCIAWNSMKLATTGKRLVRSSFVGDLGIHQCVHSQTIPESPWGAGFNSSCLTINPPKKSKLKPI